MTSTKDLSSISQETSDPTATQKTIKRALAAEAVKQSTAKPTILMESFVQKAATSSEKKPQDISLHAEHPLISKEQPKPSTKKRKRLPLIGRLLKSKESQAKKPNKDTHIRLPEKVLLDNSQKRRLIDRLSGNPSPEIAKPHTVIAIKKGEKIILGVKPQSELKTEHVKIPAAEQAQAITTLGELTQALDIISQLSAHTTQQDITSKEVINNTADPAIKAEADKQNIPPGCTILVSEDILTFLDDGKRELEGKETSSAQTIFQETKNQENKPKQYVTIASSQREIIIELTLLKKLLQQQNLRREMHHTLSFENTTALEELGLHTMSPQDWSSDLLLVFVYHTLIYLLSEDKRQTDTSTTPYSYRPQTLFPQPQPITL